MYHSRIAGVDTEVVLQTVVAKSGARSLLTLRRTNCGGTAGVEQDVSQINCLVVVPSFFVPMFLFFFSLYVVLLCISLPECLSVSVLVSIASCLSSLLEGRHTLRPQLLTVCLHS